MALISCRLESRHCDRLLSQNQRMNSFPIPDSGRLQLPQNTPRTSLGEYRHRSGGVSWGWTPRQTLTWGKWSKLWQNFGYVGQEPGRITSSNTESVLTYPSLPLRFARFDIHCSGSDGAFPPRWKDRLHFWCLLAVPFAFDGLSMSYTKRGSV
jgi:hypothetical protein